MNDQQSKLAGLRQIAFKLEECLVELEQLGQFVAAAHVQAGVDAVKGMVEDAASGFSSSVGKTTST